MRLLIIRHAEPDYVNDSITEKGKREAKILAEYLSDIKADYVYLSPLGRARLTAAPYLEKSGKEAKVLDWLEEFPSRIDRPDDDKKKQIAWDWLPSDWTKDERFYDNSRWKENERFIAGGVGKKYDEIVEAFDDLIAKHGYIRRGNIYLAEHSNTDTLLFFCHFGLECVLLSRLLNISPMILWHGLCAAPASTTCVVTEERRKGYASFRVLSFGDASYLPHAGEDISFHARFCEVFENENERHD